MIMITDVHTDIYGNRLFLKHTYMYIIKRLVGKLHYSKEYMINTPIYLDFFKAH